MSDIITITNVDWTMAGLRTDWADDAQLDAKLIDAFADAQYAYLINNTGATLRGWAYTGDGSFTGPARADAISLIYGLMTASADYVLALADDIRADVAAGRA